MIPEHRELPLVATAAKRGNDMVLDGVSVDDRVVREIAAVVGKPLAQKLEQALLFSAEVVALTRPEKDAVLAALDRMPWEYEEVRELLLAGPKSGVEETGIALEVGREVTPSDPRSSTSKPWRIIERSPEPVSVDIF